MRPKIKTGSVTVNLLKMHRPKLAANPMNQKNNMRTQVPRRVPRANGTISSCRFDNGTLRHVSDPVRVAKSANDFNVIVDYPSTML